MFRISETSPLSIGILTCMGSRLTRTPCALKLSAFIYLCFREKLILLSS